MPDTVVLLHGFAGTGHTWDAVVERLDGERYTALAPDIRGHGSAGGRRPIDFASCAADVLAAAPERFDLCGYSMGGRLALHVALAAPGRVRRLVLLSATAGIEDEAERAARRDADQTLAAECERGTIEAFAARWTAQPLFADDPQEVRERARADVLRNAPGGLAASLRGIGTGAMEPLWARLPELGELDVTFAAGARDRKFTLLAQRMAATLPGSRTVVVPGAGHALPREAPGALAQLIHWRAGGSSAVSRGRPARRRRRRDPGPGGQ